MLDCLEEEGKSSSHEELVSSISEVAPYLSSDYSLIVFIDSDLLNQSIDLCAIGEELNLALLVIDSLLTFWAKLNEFVSAHEEFRRP